MLNSAFNAKGSKGIIAVVQVRVAKIYVTSVEALREKGKRNRVKLRKSSNLTVF
jgi:hypothetical protein